MATAKFKHGAVLVPVMLRGAGVIIIIIKLISISIIIIIIIIVTIVLINRLTWHLAVGRTIV